MKKTIAMGLMLGMLTFTPPVFAASHVEKAVNAVVGGGKKVVSLVFQGSHTVLHAIQSVGSVGMDVVHAGLDALEIPFNNGDSPS